MRHTPTIERPIKNLLAAYDKSPPRPQINALLAGRSRTEYSALVNALMPAVRRPQEADISPPRPAYCESWARANFGNELQKPFWTGDDAVPILLGIDPVFAPPFMLAKNEFRDETALEAMRLRRLVADAQLVGDLPERFRPYRFINWALTQHISVPGPLLKVAVERGLPIVGSPNTLEAWKTKFLELTEQAERLLATRDARIAELEAELDSRSEVACRVQDKSRQEQSKLNCHSHPEKNDSNQEEEISSGLSRKYNIACKLFYGLANGALGIEYGPMAKPKLKKILDALGTAGIHADDETVARHLRHGAEQCARQSKSPR